MAGYVYILTNKHMPGLVKIGRTERCPTQRMAQLCRGAGVPGVFELAGFVEVDNPRAAENTLHRKYSDMRVEQFCRYPNKEI
jgi:T5orf172 domain